MLAAKTQTLEEHEWDKSEYSLIDMKSKQCPLNNRIKNFVSHSLPSADICFSFSVEDEHTLVDSSFTTHPNGLVFALAYNESDFGTRLAQHRHEARIKAIVCSSARLAVSAN